MQVYDSQVSGSPKRKVTVMTPDTQNSQEAVAPLPSYGGVGFTLRAMWTSRRSGRDELRSVTRRFALPPVDPNHVRDYREALGFVRPGLPLTYLYVFAQRSHLSVMLEPDFPYALPGIVHVANELRWFIDKIDVFQPERASVLEVRVEPEPNSVTGAHFLTLHATLMQEELPLALCSSRYLVKRGAKLGGQRSRDEADQSLLPHEWARYALLEDAGRAYARLTGDANPIHLWAWSARMLGFQQPIIHGMHTLGRVAAEMERIRGARLLRLQARFLRPIPIPGEVSVVGRGDHAQAWSGGELTLDAEGVFEVSHEETEEKTQQEAGYVS
jgi:acyl dehydratase